MNGILTDPRLLALQQAAKGKDPQAFRQELMARVDRGELPSSLVYVMNLQNRAELIGKAMSPEQQQQAMQQPSIRQRLENAVANAAPPPQMQQQMPVQQPPMMGGAPAGLPATSAATLARPGTFSAKGGGIVAFNDRGLVEGEEGKEDEEDLYGGVLRRVEGLGDLSTYGRPAPEAVPAQAPPSLMSNVDRLRGMKARDREAEIIKQIAERKLPKSEDLVVARQQIAKQLGVDDLNKQQAAYFKDAIKGLADERRMAKGMFFLEAAKNVGSSTQGLLGAVATGFAQPAVRYGETTRDINKALRGLKGDELKAVRGIVDSKLSEWDQIAGARKADEAAQLAQQDKVLGIVQEGASRDIKAAQDRERAQIAAGPPSFDRVLASRLEKQFLIIENPKSKPEDIARANAEIERLTNIKSGGANSRIAISASTRAAETVQQEMKDAIKGTGPFAELQKELNLANAKGDKEAAAAIQQRIEAFRIQRQNQLTKENIQNIAATGGAASAGLEGLEDFFR